MALKSQKRETGGCAAGGESWPEQELVEAAKTDMEAFAKLYDLHFDRIYSYAYHRTRSHQDAEDVTAQTFQQALEHIGSFQWRGVPFAAWLYRIASNIVAGRYRRRLPETHLEEAYDLAGADPSPEDAAMLSEQAGELRESVATLPPSQQQAVVLKFAQGLRNREIGEIMGCSEGAVKQLIHRALVGLRGRVRG